MMKLSIIFSLAATLSSAAGFAAPASERHAFTSSALGMSTATESSTPFAKPPTRIIREQLPILYVYDHCPFCVRVRFAMGVKNIKHNLHFLANDDVATPTKLVGKKIAPIFEWPEEKLIMSESLDIIAKVDTDERFGPTNLLAPEAVFVAETGRDVHDV
jgi:hypothetical protein